MKLTTVAGVNFSRPWKKRLVWLGRSCRRDTSRTRGCARICALISRNEDHTRTNLGISRGVEPVGRAEKNFPPGGWTCAIRRGVNLQR